MTIVFRADDEQLFGKYPNDESFVVLNGPVEAIVIVECWWTMRLPLAIQMERLLLLLGALAEKGAKIKLISPYLPYSLQDRWQAGRPAPASRILGRLLAAVGVTEVVTIDLHNPSAVGDWPIKVINKTSEKLFAPAVAKWSGEEEILILAPDHGAAARAEALAHRLAVDTNREWAWQVAEKLRLGPGEVLRASQVEISKNIKKIVLVDDLINTGSTLLTLIDQIKIERSDINFAIVATHGLFTNAKKAQDLKKQASIFITNSIENNQNITCLPLPTWW